MRRELRWKQCSQLLVLPFLTFQYKWLNYILWYWWFFWSWIYFLLTQELVTKVFQQMWFTPLKGDENSDVLVKRVVHMTDVVSSYSWICYLFFLHSVRYSLTLYWKKKKRSTCWLQRRGDLNLHVNFLGFTY